MSSVDSGGANSWQISIYEAAGKGDESRVRELIRERPHSGAGGENSKEVLWTALLKAVGRGHEPLTRLLLESGARVDEGSEGDILYRAAEAGRDKIVSLLLEYGANIRAREPKFRRTAIFPAAQKNHQKALRLLLDAGADVDARDTNHQTVLLYLASEKPDRQVRWGDDILRLILSTDGDLEAKDKEGRTALLWAAATGRENFARLLLTSRSETNANIHATNVRGKTALHLAVENKRVDLVELLLEYGADVQARSDGGWTCLHNAAEKGHTEIAACLLERGADVNATTSSGMSPLHWAARNGHLELVKLLLQQPGLRRNCKDSFDSTPMLGAADTGHIDIVKLLSPSNDAGILSSSARRACEGFQATVVDFGMEKRPMNHHKHSVYELLYGWNEAEDKPAITTLTRNVPAKPTFRWIHLGANNMSWIETLMSKHFVENSARDVDGFKLLEKSFGQAHRGQTVHSHFMRPLCQRFDPTERVGKDVVLSDVETLVPLKETTSNGTAKKTTLATQGRKPSDQNHGNRKGEKVEKITKSTPPGKANNKPKGSTSEKTPTSSNRAPRAERHGNIVLFMPYLHYETHDSRKAMSNTIDQATTRVTNRERKYSISGSSDQMLIHAYLHSTHNLQIRRTLDQFYYHAISTEDRDEDQVVWRYTRDKGKEKKLFMVDQLWLWILSDDLIVTSFPQRWEQPKNDPLNVLDGIIEEMSSKTRPPVKSVYDLAVLITGRCIGVFDRHSIHDGDYQFLDMFESSIGEVTNRETQLFKRFNDASIAAAKVLRDSRQRQKARVDSRGDNDENVSDDPIFVDTLLDIGEETALLAETKDIRDELNMISMVLKHQQAVVDDLADALFHELKGNHNQQKQAEIRRRYKEQLKIIEMHLKDVDRMDRQAEGIYTSLTHLLDLKQKHANAIEARFARDQAALTGRQGQTIMVFTIVTVIFLPMSFIAAVFAIPIQDFEGAQGTPSLPFSYVAKYMFGVGLAISIPLIAVAFAVDSIGEIMQRSVQKVFGYVGGAKGKGDRGQKSKEPLRGGEVDRMRSIDKKRYGSSSEGDIPISVRHRTERSWREKEPGQRGRSKDLERGVDGG